MKLITILAALFISIQAFAANICDYQETFEFFQVLQKNGVKRTKTSSNPKNWTAFEQEMISSTIRLQHYYKDISKKKALQEFADLYQGKPGSNAGEIVYFTISGKQYALVHYWPGENEYGAFLQLKNGNTFQLVAEITDSFIDCK